MSYFIHLGRFIIHCFIHLKLEISFGKTKLVLDENTIVYTYLVPNRKQLQRYLIPCQQLWFE